MLQFTADSDRGRLLGLGLSLGNLELLEAGEPAFVSLDEHQSSGTLLIACAEDHEGVARARRELDAASEPVIELLFDAEARETLRRGTPIVRPLAAPDLDTAICFSGADELEMLTGLRGHPLFADVQVAGLDEYWLHEQGACPGCPRCAERAATADFFTPPRLTQRLLSAYADAPCGGVGSRGPTWRWACASA